MHFKIFQQFWYRHKRVAALLDVKKQIANTRKHAWNDLSHKSRQIEDEFDTDNILSITDAWDLNSEKLEVLKDNIQRCLNEDRDFFKSDRVEDISNPDDELAEAEKAFDSVDKDANGAYRVLKKQVLALRLRLLVPKAKLYCIGRRINSDKCVTTYLSEKRWANLSPTVRKEKHDKLARWRGHGEKWLSLEEPAIALAFGHIPSDHRCFYEFERRRLPIRAFNAVISTLQAVTIIDDLRKLWCRQLIRKRLNTECHPNHCFCNGTDVALDEASLIEPPTRATADNEQLAQVVGGLALNGSLSDQPRREMPHEPSQLVPTVQQNSGPGKRQCESASTASKRRRVHDIGHDIPLTLALDGGVSSSNDNRNEQSEESSPSSATDPTEGGNSAEVANEAAAASSIEFLATDSQTVDDANNQEIPFSVEGQDTQNQVPTSNRRVRIAASNAPSAQEAPGHFDAETVTSTPQPLPNAQQNSGQICISTLPLISNGGSTRRNESREIETQSALDGNNSEESSSVVGNDGPASNERAQIAASHVPSAPRRLNAVIADGGARRNEYTDSASGPAHSESETGNFQGDVHSNAQQSQQPSLHQQYIEGFALQSLQRAVMHSNPADTATSHDRAMGQYGIPPPANHNAVMSLYEIPPASSHTEAMSQYGIPPPTSHDIVMGQYGIPPASSHTEAMSQYGIPPPINHEIIRRAKGIY